MYICMCNAILLNIEFYPFSLSLFIAFLFFCRAVRGKWLSFGDSEGNVILWNLETMSRAVEAEVHVMAVSKVTPSCVWHDSFMCVA